MSQCSIFVDRFQYMDAVNAFGYQSWSQLSNERIVTLNRKPVIMMDLSRTLVNTSSSTCTGKASLAKKGNVLDLETKGRPIEIRR